MDRIAIIGLGYIGASIGYTLRLKHSKKYQVVGFDHESKAQQQADKTGALDESTWSLGDAVSNADIVVIATPASAVETLLTDMSVNLKPGAVVTDTTSAAGSITAWAEAHLPRSVGFVSGHPLVSGNGLEDATGAVFEGARWALAPTATAPQDAVRRTIKLVEDLGATPFFISVEEHDSYLAAATNLPIIVSNAMMLAAARSPSWREIGKFATGQFSEVSSASRFNPEVNIGSLTGNAEMTMHWIDQMIIELADFRAMLDDDECAEPDSALALTLNDAWDARLRWENGIEPGTIQRPALPTSGDMMLGVLVGHNVAERLRGVRNRPDERNY